MKSQWPQAAVVRVLDVAAVVVLVVGVVVVVVVLVVVVLVVVLVVEAGDRRCMLRWTRRRSARTHHCAMSNARSPHTQTDRGCRPSRTRDCIARRENIVDIHLPH